MPASDVEAAFAAGVTDFGENRVQELLQKLPKLNMTGHRAHMIGHLQTNKVRQLIDKVCMIQVVETQALGQENDREAAGKNNVTDVLCEVNIAGEASKSGVEPSNLLRLLEDIVPLSHIKVRGLMAIPPLSVDKGLTRHYFAQIYKLFIDIGGKKSDNKDMHILSMGMSSDFDVAIEEGSNMVRVGTAIFGRRVYNSPRK